MRNHDYSHAERLVEFSNEVHDFRARLAVEVAGGFIRQQKARFDLSAPEPAKLSAAHRRKARRDDVAAGRSDRLGPMLSWRVLHVCRDPLPRSAAATPRSPTGSCWESS